MGGMPKNAITTSVSRIPLTKKISPISDHPQIFEISCSHADSRQSDSNDFVLVSSPLSNQSLFGWDVCVDGVN